MFLNLVTDRISQLNEYDILWPCYHGDAAKRGNLQKAVLQLPHAVRRQWPFWPVISPGPVTSWAELLGAELGLTPPCLDHRCAKAVPSIIFRSYSLVPPLPSELVSLFRPGIQKGKKQIFHPDMQKVCSYSILMHNDKCDTCACATHAHMFVFCVLVQS